MRKVVSCHHSLHPSHSLRDHGFDVGPQSIDRGSLGRKCFVAQQGIRPQVWNVLREARYPYFESVGFNVP